MVKCDLCGRTAFSEEQAADRFWVPSYWRDEREVLEPVCNQCLREHFKLTPYDDFEYDSDLTDATRYNGGEPRWHFKFRWAMANLRRKGELICPERGKFQMTERGRQAMKGGES